MRNKLQYAVAITNLFSSKESCTFKLNCKNKNVYNRNFLLVLLVSFFFLSASKSFAQLAENFNSGIPSEWSIIDNGIGTSNWQTTTDGYLGTNGVSINPSADNIGDQNTAQYFLVTPQVSVPENGEIQFYTKQSSAIDNGAEYEIRISTAAQPDINGFNIVIQSYTEVNLNIGDPTSYEKKVVELPTSIPAGFNIYIAFVAVNTQNGAVPTGDEWFVDNVSVVEGCVEIEEEEVAIDAITVDGAEVSWTHPTATNFEIQILPSQGIPATSGIPVTGNSYSLTSLDEDTEFDVYLAAVCDNNTQSTFTGPYTFKTLKLGLSCEAPIVVSNIATTPYTLVDNLANWENPDVVYTTQGANCVSGASTTNYLNGNKIFLEYTPTEDGLVTLTQLTGTGGEPEDNCYNSRSSLFVYESCADVGVNCVAGVITTNAFEPKTISNLLVQAGENYIIVVSSQLSTTAGICFELEISSPTCAPPGDMVYNNLTEDSVRFSWGNIGGFAESWEYVTVPTEAGEPTGSGILTTTNTNNLINSGLTPATTYDAYVRSICDGTPGVWSAPITFTTQCTVFNTPYSTDFATATNVDPEACWTTIDVNNDGTTWSFIGGYATVRTNTSLNENNDFYVSPQINFDGTQKRVRYKRRTTQGVSTYALKLSTTGVGVDDFTTPLTTETINNTDFQEIIVDIPETITGNVNIAWVVEPNTTETALRFSIDDVFIEDKPSCPAPTNLGALNITTNSAWLTWAVGGEESQWQVAIQNEGSGIPTGDGVIANSNFPYPATGLNPGTRYEYYVRAYCATDDQSEWVGPMPFITLCTSYDTPFFESFNDEDPNTQKFCWSVNDNNNDNATWSINETAAILQTSVVQPPSSFDDYLISPAINLEGIKELKYKYRAQFSFLTGDPRYGLEVLMSTTNTNPGSFSVISPFEVITNSEYIEKSVIIEGNSTVYIAFRVPPEFSGNFSILNIEDVSITDAPACPDPSNLIVETTTTNGAVLSWAEGYQETAWNVVVQPAGSGLPTITGETVTVTNYTASSLDADTEYEFYITADCGADTSSWVGPVTFRTLCTAFTSPFIETFNNDSTSEDCWQILNDNNDGETWELDSASFPFEGDQAAAMFTGSNGQNEDWLISPTITISENQRLRYYYRVYDSFFTEDLEVLLSINGTGLDQFTTVLYDSDDDPVLINNVEYKVKIINFPAGISGDINIAFHVPYFASTDPYRGQTLVIDNVNIEDVPDCPEPTNVTINNITDIEFQVNWDANGSETAWEISVQPTGTPAPVGDADPEYLYNATTNPYTITGLTASTMYDVYVRAVCSGNDGAWTGPTEVTTKCSFENLCQYTFVLTSDANSSSTLDITQNNQVTQSLPFTGQSGEEFPVFLCSGTEFSLYFDTIGWSAPQYANYQFNILNDQGETVYSSPTGLIPRTTVYSGTTSCGVIACPQPTDLTISNQSVFSWTPGGSETQWEVAVQPLQNGTIPQSGTIVSTSSYTPTASDFNDLNAATYEYFVRAVCGTDDESYWSGPFEFVRNDEVSTAITLPINSYEVCNVSSTEVSFINASASSEAMSCEGTNNGDVWFQFTAESVIHSVEINNFSGGLRDSNGHPLYPEIVMTLYKDNAGSLEELACSYDNVIMAMYTSELVIGENYKIRLTLNTPNTSEYIFNVCVKTPEDLCLVDIVNGGFEEPSLGILSGVTTIISLNTVPGWRSNLDSTNNIFYWEALNAPGFEPYEGGQCVQILSDQGTTIDPNDPNIKGLYRDFDTSEITLLEYSFAHLARFDGNTVQLFAGPVGGPYTMIKENLGATLSWTVIADEYQVPAGQDQTRFIFRGSDGDDIGNVIDAVSILPNNEIITAPFDVDCTNPIANLQANGIGEWVASDINPGEVTIINNTPGAATITNFLNPGTYNFIWQTSYCSYYIELIYNGISEMPTVETPIEYCLNETADTLTATTTSEYSLIWYTEATGGIGSDTAPTPDTTVVGDTSYYVANQDENGCEGPRAELIVTINEAMTPELSFSYLDTCILATDNPTATLADDFVTGGTFSAATLTVDATTGEIDITSATEGMHDVVYTYDGDTDTCTIADTYTATITFSQAIAAVTTFNYGATTFCELESATITPNLAAGFTTGGTFTSSTLTVDATTGEINLSTATVGNHDVTYTYVADENNCEEEGDFIVSIEVTEANATVTEFTYTESSYCADSVAILPELATGFTTGGIFSASTGLSIDAVTGEITIDTSAVGDYIVTYQVDQDITTCTEGNSSTFAISINAIITPELSFTYSDTCVLTSTDVTPTLNSSFVLGGTFSATTLTVDATTGEIDITSATAGTHNVTYTYNGDATMCTIAGSYMATIVFTQAIPAVTTFNYGATSFCELNTTTVTPNVATGFSTGGTFSSSTLTVDAITGELDLTGATSAMHTIMYTYDGDETACLESGNFTVTVEIIEKIVSNTSFTYADDVYCATSTNVFPELATGFTTGGTFSAETGLSINASTGEVNVLTSTLGNYTISYEISENLTTCAEASVSTFNITILDTIEANIDGACNNEEYWLTVSPINSSYNSSDVTYTWMDANGNIVGEDSETFNVTAYVDQNQNITLPTQFTVTIAFGSCETTTSFTTDRSACRNIPKGISPDGNGKNDTFNLTGFGVTNMIIFNRYGKEVYSFSGNYSNQWNGESNKGKELPDGTYFYNIQKEDGTSITGWVYINRAH